MPSSDRDHPIGIKSRYPVPDTFQCGLGPTTSVGVQRNISVWGAREGHGTTTIAGALSHLVNARFHSHKPADSDWIWPGNWPDPSTGVRVFDRGMLDERRTSSGITIVVLRGPCSLALKELAQTSRHIHHLVLVDEPWRPLRPCDVERTLWRSIDAVVPFSTALARYIDIGTVAARFARLDVFEDLARFAREKFLVTPPTA